jgi:1,5-anhydro-D-fructose reductase (1,5-anhydro-D-mannitol-forming)
MNWALMGASTIASQFMLGAIRAQPGNGVRWVVSSDPARAAAYAAGHSNPNHGADIAAALAVPGVGAVHIPFTTEEHGAPALASGKNVLGQKSLAMAVARATGMVTIPDRIAA